MRFDKEFKIFDLSSLRSTTPVKRNLSDEEIQQLGDTELFCNTGFHDSTYVTGDNCELKPLGLCPRHPVDDHGLEPRDLQDHPVYPTLRLFLQWYLDDFGTWSKKQFSVGGSYICLGNLPHHLQVTHPSYLFLISERKHSYHILYARHMYECVNYLLS